MGTGAAWHALILDQLSQFFRDEPDARAFVLAGRFPWGGQGDSGEGILDLIASGCELFDELAADLLPGYSRRGPLLYPGIESVRRACCAREETG